MNDKCCSIALEKTVNLSLKEVEKMTVAEKNDYFRMLRDYCQSIRKNSRPKITLTQRIMAKNGRRLRNFLLKLAGRKTCRLMVALNLNQRLSQRKMSIT